MAIITLLTKSGFIGGLIIFSSILALSSFIERMIRLQSWSINTDAFLDTVEGYVRSGELQMALDVCSNARGPIPRVVAAGISHMSAGKDAVVEYLDAAAARELPIIEAKIGIISTVAHIAPLLGLLGTVNGMIKAFQVIQERAEVTGLASPADLAQGIWLALITTAMGLSVAIPAVVGYNIIMHRIRKLKQNMDQAASRIAALCV